MTVRRERAFRGISARLARHYLENLGGEVIDEGTSGSGDHDGADEGANDGANDRLDEGSNDEANDGADGGVVVGDGWTVTLSTERIEIGPTIEVTEVTTVFEGEETATVEDIEARFARKAMRAGG